MKKATVSPASPDLREDLVARLREAVPEAFTEGKLDIGKLQSLVGDVAAVTAERYVFTWSGKRDALAMLQAPDARDPRSRPSEQR